MNCRTRTSLAACGAPLHRYLHDAVGAALVDQQAAAVARDPHVADDASINLAGRDRPALEGLGLWIEAHQHVWPHAGFIVPDCTVDCDDRIWMRLRATR